MPRAMTGAAYAAALDGLARRDAALAGIIDAHGRPPVWRRDQGFATLVLLILEQQVSVASGRVTYERLAETAGAVTPEALLALGEAGLRAAGLSRQKARYVAGLAERVREGALDLRRIARSDDAAAREALTAVTGIGAWTADIYLLTALGRPDVWPARDLALQVAAQEVKRLPARPDEDEMIALAEPWRPWRAVAARLLWHHYRSTGRGVRDRRADGPV